MEKYLNLNHLVKKAGPRGPPRFGKRDFPRGPPRFGKRAMLNPLSNLVFLKQAAYGDRPYLPEMNVPTDSFY